MLHRSTPARVALAVALIAAFALPAPALAQDKAFTLKLSSWVPPSHGMHPAIKEWGESISRATDGTIKVTLYPAQQLGKADDHDDMARDGIAEVTYIALGYQAGRLPMGEGVSLPFLMTNADGGSRAVDEWYRKYHVKDLPFYVAGCAWLMNKSTYEQMSPAQKKASDAHCSMEWTGEVGKAWGDYEAAGRAEMRALAGHTVYTLTPDEIPAWRSA